MGSEPVVSTVNKQDAQREWVNGLIVSAQKRGWYGKIVIEVKRGMIDVVIKEESLKPPCEA